MMQSSNPKWCCFIALLSMYLAFCIIIIIFLKNKYYLNQILSILKKKLKYYPN